jgi:predicted lipoprotein with Yx(FWY)xxD motif
MRTRPLLALLAVGTIALAACGSDNSSSSSSATAAPAAQSATTAASSKATTAPASSATTANDSAYGAAYGGGSSATTAAPAAASSSATISLATSSLGKIVVDSKGDTLYAFLKDTSGTSVCSDACAKAWPAAVATGTPTAATGITAALTTVARSDGSMQLKLGQWPLYTFAGDSGPGQTNGQGTASVWYVVGADGNPIK